MRISIESTDPGFRPDLLGLVEVFLDDVRVVRCVAADEEQGLVYARATDKNGDCVVDRVAYTAPVTCACGAVRIAMKDGSPVPAIPDGRVFYKPALRLKVIASGGNSKLMRFAWRPDQEMWFETFRSALPPGTEVERLTADEYDAEIAEEEQRGFI